MDMADSAQKSKILPNRLCSEIQLFDLCDLDSCRHKSGGFCTDTELIFKFEKISEDEIRQPEIYTSVALDDADLDDEFEFGDEGDEDGFEDDYDIDREEE
jgi:hypothetical protein